MSTDYESGYDPAGDPGEYPIATQPERGTGLVTVPRERGLSPALLAEQQRAKSEIEAALTIAAGRPRDQRDSLDRIVTACQRPGLAANSQYCYSRGGSEISGPNIRLLEVIAQNWGNVEWGFRELARFPAANGHAGESVVEAVAWDLETNSRVRRQFTVEHAMKAHGKVKHLTDPRDIYEYIANVAQRRVRTCLENIIPRDIQEMACEECDKTIKASLKDVGKASADMVKAFGAIGVTREMIEGRIQRRIDSITPAQIIGLRKIYASIRDGMSEAADWFSAGEAAEAPKSAAEQAKAAMRKRTAKPEPAKEPEPPATNDRIAQTIADVPTGQSPAQSYLAEIVAAETKTTCNALRMRLDADSTIADEVKSDLAQEITRREEAIRSSRGPRTNGNKEMFGA